MTAKELAESIAFTVLACHHTEKFLKSPSGTPLIQQAVHAILHGAKHPLPELLKVANAALEPAERLTDKMNYRYPKLREAIAALKAKGVECDEKQR